ncbi:MAG: hypothetical protein WB852_07900, partial [Thermoplasmata archaeon]
MLTQSFNLIDENWHARELRRHRAVILMPVLLACLVVGTSIYVGVTAPTFLETTLLVWVLGVPIVGLVLLFGIPSERTTMSVGSSSVIFSGPGRRVLTVHLDRKRVSVILIDQSVDTRRTSGPFGTHTPYWGVFSEVAERIPLTAEALDVLRRELPRAGLSLYSAAPLPFQPGT